MAAEAAVAGAAALYSVYNQNQSRVDAKKANRSEDRARQNASLEARKLKEAEEKRERGEAAARARRTLSTDATRPASALGSPSSAKPSISSLLGL